jgi:hypothetical protein
MSNYDEEYEHAYDQAIDFSEAPAEAFVRKVFTALGVEPGGPGIDDFEELVGEATTEVAASMNAAVAHVVALIE